MTWSFIGRTARISLSMAIESNLRNSLPWRTQCSLSRDAASSLVSRTCVANEFQAPPSTRLQWSKEAKYAQDWILRHVGGVHPAGDTTPGSDREGGSPPYSQRDQITRFSAIFDLRAATPATIDEARSCRANSVTYFFLELDRRICSSFSDKFFVW